METVPATQPSRTGFDQRGLQFALDARHREADVHAIHIDLGSINIHAGPTGHGPDVSEAELFHLLFGCHGVSPTIVSASLDAKFARQRPGKRGVSHNDPPFPSQLTCRYRFKNWVLVHDGGFGVTR